MVIVSLCVRSDESSAPCGVSNTSGEKAGAKDQNREGVVNSHGRKDSQGRGCLEEATHVESILCDPAKGYGTALYGRICGHQDARRVQVRMLRATVVSI